MGPAARFYGGREHLGKRKRSGGRATNQVGAGGKTCRLSRESEKFHSRGRAKKEEIARCGMQDQWGGK